MSTMDGNELNVTARPSLSAPDGLVVSANGQEVFYLRVLIVNGQFVAHLLSRMDNSHNWDDLPEVHEVVLDG